VRVRAIALLALLASLLTAAGAGAAARPAGNGKLSPRLGSIARSPALRGAAPGQQSRGVGLPPSGAGSLVHRGERITVEVRVGAGAAAATAGRLRAAGAGILDVSGRYGVVTAAVDPSDLRAVAGVSGVRGVTEVLAPLIAGANEGGGPGGFDTSLNTCQGSVTSEGDTQVRANALRSALDLDGAGVKVGALSDSYDRDLGDTRSAAEDVASGDLPGVGNPCGHASPVQVIDDGSAGGNDEGRAMLQIVHDLAPGANLAFATASTGSTAFATNIRRLEAIGSKVIVDDVTYFEEPFFQDGPVANAVNEVASRGVAYFSSAANNNLRIGANDPASWESPAFRDAGSCPGDVGAVQGETNCEDFDPAAGVDTMARIDVAAGRRLRIDLQWAQPWDGVTTDLDAWLIGGAGAVRASSQNDNVGTTQKPFEFLTYLNTTSATQSMFLVISRDEFAGDNASPRLKYSLLQNGGGVTGVEYATGQAGDVVGPTIFGHNGTSGAQSVAAVRYSSGGLEAYSSHGPVTLRFGPVTGTGPAAALATPEVLTKPDVAATDCGQTTFFTPTADPAVFRFCGTSAAAPHAAGVGALQLAGTPSASGGDATAAQRTTATRFGGFPATFIGGGLLNATSAALPPDLSVGAAPPALSNNATPTFTFAANRAASFSCAFEGAAEPCSSPFTPAPLGDGAHSFTVTATDPLGHSRTSAPAAFTIDTTAPDTFISSGPRSRTRDATPTVGFGSADPGARFECRFDAAPFAPCAGSATPARLHDGGHSFEARAIDVVGNADQTPAPRRFVVDTVRPRVRIRRHPAHTTRSRRATFKFRASEKVRRLECRVDRKRFRRCRTTKRLRVKVGRHRMQVRAIDRAGNRGRVAKFRWGVKP
jgi:hypothetical protein